MPLSTRATTRPVRRPAIAIAAHGYADAVLGGFLVDVVLAFFDLWDSTDHRKCKRAYRSAWKACGAMPGGPIERLREAFKSEHVTRAYTDPDGPIVSPWLSAWRAGLDPRAASRSVRASR